jgi:hypothetical protein
MQFLKKLTATGFGLALAVLGGSAQAQGMNPAGFWRCIVNNEIVSIDVQVQIAPDQSLQFAGGIIYVQTSRAFQVQGPGRWLLSPPEPGYPGGLFRFQMQPAAGNHAIFSMFAAPTGDPNFLANQFYNPQTGTTTHTNCQRLG